MRWAAIDPGLEGAIAFGDSTEVNMMMPDGVYDMPTVTSTNAAGKSQRFVSAIRLRLLLAQHDIDRLVIEKTWAQGAVGRGGAKSFFKQGMTYAIPIGVVAGMQIPHSLVTPQAWQRHFGLLGGDKDDAREAAMVRWPVHQTRFKRKKDDGRADAALLLAYAMEREQGLVR